MCAPTLLTTSCVVTELLFPFVCVCVCACVCCRTTRFGGKPLGDDERQSVLAVRRAEEQAYQSARSRDFEGLTSGTRTVCRRILREVGKVRYRPGSGVVGSAESVVCVGSSQTPSLEPTFEVDDPDNWSSRRAALLRFAGAARKVCRSVLAS